MPQLARTASLLVALSLLTSAATAYAECAWVFWQEAMGPPTHESSTWPVSSWETKSACEQALTKKLSSDTESRRKDKDTDTMVDHAAGKPRLWIQKKGRPDLITTYTYVCLPDTVDPRVEGEVMRRRCAAALLLAWWMHVAVRRA
jgi:hypothetical protein